MSKEIKIRSLYRKDRKLLSSLFVKYAGKVGSKAILTMINADAESTAEGKEKSEDELIQIGVNVLLAVANELEEDIEKWFADLINRPVEEMDNLPFDIDLKIMEQLKAAPEFKNFFFGLLRQYNLIRMFLPQSREKKEK
jgi:hypothetical protein